MAENRVTAKLGDWEPPQAYNQPHLEPDASVRTKEHEVLGDVSIVQALGEDAETFVLRGEAYEEDIGELRRMNGTQVVIRHSVFTGKVFILGIRSSSTSSWDKTDEGKKWVYQYNIDLVKVTDDG